MLHELSHYVKYIITLASQRELPLFSGEFRKRSKCDCTCCNGHGIKRADGLIELPDTFAALDLDLEIARFVSDLDYLMASTRQCLLNQFPDLSVCADQKKFHKDTFLFLISGVICSLSV